jgi:hypothetical protein
VRSQMSEMVSVSPISRARGQEDRRAVVGPQRGTARVLAILAHNASRIARALPQIRDQWVWVVGRASVQEVREPPQPTLINVGTQLCDPPQDQPAFF